MRRPTLLLVALAGLSLGPAQAEMARERAWRNLDFREAAAPVQMWWTAGDREADGYVVVRRRGLYPPDGLGPGWYGYEVLPPPYGRVVPAPLSGSPVLLDDPYAAPHEIRGGQRTIYVPGRGRVFVADPPF